MSRTSPVYPPPEGGEKQGKAPLPGGNGAYVAFFGPEGMSALVDGASGADAGAGAAVDAGVRIDLVVASPWEMALTGHSPSQLPQLMHSSLIT